MLIIVQTPRASRLDRIRILRKYTLHFKRWRVLFYYASFVCWKVCFNTLTHAVKLRNLKELFVGALNTILLVLLVFWYLNHLFGAGTFR